MDDEKLRVLVVDDDPALRRLMTLVLRLEGFDVDTAADGLKALECLQDHAVDVVVLDLLMPRMDGMTCYRAIRTAGNDVPVVITSVLDSRNAARTLGAEAVLPKPFDPERLVTAVRDVLPHRRPGQRRAPSGSRRHRA
jgi:DNA-binding response OmpR family regulator